MALLPLETFRRTIGYHPWHYWQLYSTSKAPIESACSGIVRQYAWHDSNAVGRTDILLAIESAEQLLFDYLGYWPAPKYGEETHAFPTPYANGLRYSGNWGRWLSMNLDQRYIQALGIEALTLIEAGVAVTRSDVDGDTLKETFTLTVNTTITDATQIAVYFAAADRLDGDSAGDRWRIQPVKISISGGVATIRGAAWLLVKPVKYEYYDASATDDGALALDTDANYVTTVDVYRRYTNGDGTTTTTSQGLLTWETPGGSCCGSATSSTDPASIATAIARVGIRDATNGIVIPAEASYNTTSATWSAIHWTGCVLPDRATIRTYAGYALREGQMDPFFQQVVTRLAAAELEGPICACDKSNRELYRWQFDLSRAAGSNDEQYSISPADLDNPFGTRRGHVWSWKQVRNRRLLGGLLPG